VNQAATVVGTLQLIPHSRYVKRWYACDQKGRLCRGIAGVL
jgi:hypothetical protein